MPRSKLVAHRSWGRKRGRFKVRYIFWHVISPVCLLLYVFFQLSDIFIDFSYYNDVYLPCGNRTIPYNQIRNHVKYFQKNLWQTVEANETYVLSAFLDARIALRTRNQVRILGISTENHDAVPPTDYCQFWYRDSVVGDSVRARRFVIQEHGHLRYRPVLFSCVLPDVRKSPAYVSLSRSRCGKAQNILYITHTDLSPYDTQPKDKFTICFSPFVREYSNTKQLIETTEVAFTMGADKVAFYNFSSQSNIRKLVDMYRAEGKAELYDWSAPVNAVEREDPRLTSDIHYNGQVIAFNDCFYRHLYSSKYTVIMSVDELIVPAKERNWDQLVDSFPDRTFVIDYGAYLFQNAFVVGKSHSDTGGRNPANAAEDRIVSVNTAIRKPEMDLACNRSTFILVNGKVVAVGVHFPFQFIESTTYIHVVPPEVAKLYYYPTDELGTSVTSNTMWSRFAYQIANRLNSFHDMLGSSIFQEKQRK